MKNFLKLFAIIALVAVIGFSMTACDDGGGGGGAAWPNNLNGTKWRSQDGGYTIEFKTDNTFISGNSTLPIVSAVENGKIIVTYLNENETLCTSYSISGTTLTFTNPSNRLIASLSTWTKVGGSGGYVAVTSITGVPSSGVKNTNITLSGTVVPSNATNKTISWTIKTDGGTGSTITGNTLRTTSSGTVTVTATIANGKTENTPFTADFNISITDSFVAVTDITGVPASGTVGTALALNGTVVPNNATNTIIQWTVKSAGTTGANITSGNQLNVSSAGTVTVTAVISNGTASGTNYTKDFTISFSGGGGEESWINVTSMTQLNGTWKGSSTKTTPYTSWDITEVRVTEMTITITATDATTGTLSGTQKTTMTFSGSTIKDYWSTIKRYLPLPPLYIGKGWTVDDSAYSATLEVDYNDSTHSIFIDLSNPNGMQINQNGTKLRIPDGVWDGELPEIILVKQQ